MEVIHNVEVVNDKFDKDNLYIQNDFNKYKCNFENRDQSYKNKDSNLLLKNEYQVILPTTPPSEIIPYTDNTDMTPDVNLLVNVDNILHENSLIQASEKYNDSNSVNFQSKHFVDQEGSIPYNSVLYNETGDTKLSSTQNSTYTNDQFWKFQVPNIKTNTAMYRKNIDGHINLGQTTESFVTPIKDESKHPVFSNNPNKQQIHVAPNYTTNYSTTNSGDIIHSGIAMSKRQHYKDKDSVYNDSLNFGSANYYNDNWYPDYKKNFKINQTKVKFTDVNGNIHFKDVCSNHVNYIPQQNTCNDVDAYNLSEEFRYKVVNKEAEYGTYEESKQLNYLKKNDCKSYNYNTLQKRVKPYCDEVAVDTPYNKNILRNRNEVLLASYNSLDNDLPLRP